ncbi:hypothetical protein [Actinocorallia longicatena]|uniref:DUF5666 domain-containing protein n=1 Tax=Actinocorallia longicatena TaxID=111803 RepID=A0ABP6Q8J5_9ACTN
MTEKNSGENHPGASEDILETSPFQGDLDTELAPKPQRFKLPGATLILTAAVVAVAGFVGGIQADKAWGKDDGQSSAFPGGQNANRPGGFNRQNGGFGGGQGGQNGQNGGGGGFGGGGGQGGGFTTGTVTKVEGDTIYLQTRDGQTIKVKSTGTTKITVSKEGKASDLKNGATIVVVGQAGSDGTIEATTVTEGGGLRPGGFGGQGGGQGQGGGGQGPAQP